jgi:hypothetical protein
MRKIVFCIMIGMLSYGFAACTEYKDSAERYVLGAALCALQTEDDSRGLYRQVITPREFFDAKDFGRGHDDMYGNPPYRYDEEKAGAGNRRFCDHARRDDYSYSEFSIFERYAPHMLTDAEYAK